MALPLVAPLAKGAAGLVGWTGAKRSAPAVTSRLRNAGSRLSGWLGRNTGRTGAGAIGVGGGFGLSSIMDQLGIEDDRLRVATAVGVIVVVVYSVGQLVDINLGGS